MALVVGVVLVGVVAGRALRPLQHRHLAPNRVRWLLVLGAGFVLAIVADRMHGDGAVAVAIAGQALLAAGAVRNDHLLGSGVLAFGLALNLASLVVDGGVPVRPSALVDAGVLSEPELAGATLAGPRHLEDGDERLTVLGDVIPVRAARTVVSVGDVVTLAGIAAVAAGAARRRRPCHDEPDTILIDLRGHVRSDEEIDAMLRHPTGTAKVPAASAT